MATDKEVYDAYTEACENVERRKVKPKGLPTGALIYPLVECTECGTQKRTGSLWPQFGQLFAKCDVCGAGRPVLVIEEARLAEASE